MSALESPFCSPASRSRALASRISALRSSNAVAMASRAAFFTPEEVAPSAREARLADVQISETVSAVVAMD